MGFRKQYPCVIAQYKLCCVRVTPLHLDRDCLLLIYGLWLYSVTISRSNMLLPRNQRRCSLQILWNKIWCGLYKQEHLLLHQSMSIRPDLQKHTWHCIKSWIQSTFTQFFHLFVRPSISIRDLISPHLFGLLFFFPLHTRWPDLLPNWENQEEVKRWNRKCIKNKEACVLFWLRWATSERFWIA